MAFSLRRLTRYAYIKQITPVIYSCGILQNERSTVKPSYEQVRWRIYSPKYQPPTVSKIDLEQLPPEDDIRNFSPIEAAKIDEHTGFYDDLLVKKFTNIVMRKGRKLLARSLMSKAFENIKRIQIEKYHKCTTDEEREQIELNPVKILYEAVENCRPALRLMKVMKGGVVYEVPVACPQKLQTFKSINWIIESSKDKDRNTRFHDKLAWELLEAAKNEGRSVRKKQDLHRQCEANRAYAHFRW
ncbi:small ribosomal subunit protein uS7m-like [Tubulanus polymorphus]|uniref:small ribosomal subunit protein uS7m-like n=1 Tax=Tubulanus polymorphus TaxID=672921 RepID=UPI003DA51BD8